VNDVPLLGAVHVTLGDKESVGDGDRGVREHEIHVAGIGPDGHLVPMRSQQHVGSGQARCAEERQRQRHSDREQAGALALLK
jgi:hypothetical protein